MTVVPVPETRKEIRHCISLRTTVHTEGGNSGSLFSRPLCACFISTPSVCSMRSNHIVAFLLYLLYIYPPVRIGPIVSGFKNLRRNNLMNADAIVRDPRKTSMLPMCGNTRLKTRNARLKTVTFPDYTILTSVYC